MVHTESRCMTTPSPGVPVFRLAGLPGIRDGILRFHEDSMKRTVSVCVAARFGEPLATRQHR